LERIGGGENPVRGSSSYPPLLSLPLSHPAPPPLSPSQTEAAALRLRELIEGKPDALGVRLGVKTRAFWPSWERERRTYPETNTLRITFPLSPFPPLTGGCNGVSYTMNYATSKGKFDEEVLIPMASSAAAASAPASAGARGVGGDAVAGAGGAPVAGIAGRTADGVGGAGGGAPAGAGAPPPASSPAAAAAAAAGVVRVFIEPNALLKIAGTTMDWKEDDISAEFVFTNPNAKAICGCGESFSA
jgi:Fe-S cluster assembly iron-binding protein IscA